MDVARKVRGLTCTLLLGYGAVAWADTDGRADTLQRLQQGVDALSSGRLDEAVAQLETLANRGVVDAHVSFDRGLAYAARLASPNPHPGDHGQAIAAFEEARLLTRDATLADRADRAADAVRGELAKKRHRDNAPPAYEAEPTLGDRLLDAVPEGAWLALASGFAMLGLLVYFRSRPARHAPLWPLGAGVLAIPCLLTAQLQRERVLHEQPAVLIGSNVRLLDPETRRPSADADPLVEGALVWVRTGNDALLDTRSGDLRGLLPRASVRLLARGSL